ncbi:serine/threonine protein phosphatase [Ktedonobacter sp. SOSP1-85]|uniref:metallophosphoesterase family protein n=1 Tax=Ktedonobacter sp. SOSP1-85 TaxID=2778367 RepID=UPI001916173F|nr:metallophosphoesterase family protein [Ktedonobacter sp. SOSP1-85]GHO77610.1 serine/threonine protein phosphatase [Ktedonobacter sp. SOSP1-85]
MRIAIISDIHGNCLAFDAVLEDIRLRSIDQIVCLGDAIQGGPQPAETLQRLRELACPVVMGNADAWLLTGEETSPHEQVSSQQMAVREWSLAQLSEDDRVFIGQFAPTVEIALETDKKLLCFHGSPRSFDDLILPNTSEEVLQTLLGGFEAALFSGGHTHTQQLRRLGDAWYVNPGSVGLAYNWTLPADTFHADPWAEYAIVTSEGGRNNIEFLHVPFDVRSLIELIKASGRPHPETSLALYQAKA